MSTINEAVRAWAKGIYPTEAGVELLIRDGKAIYERAPWLTELEPVGDDRPRMVAVDVDELLAGTGACSGGEQRLVRIAASMLNGPPVDLAEEIPGLDRPHQVLVLAAIAHAAGSHEGSELLYDENGKPTGFHQPGSLYPWPSRVSSVESTGLDG